MPEFSPILNPADTKSSKHGFPQDRNQSFFKPVSPFIQRKENDRRDAQDTESVEQYVNNPRSGKNLDAPTRSFFEPRLGFDLSDVKIHNDADAVKSAQSINALAYTTGNHIVFNQNQFSPETSQGKKLLAHELTHVAQQQKNQPAAKTIQKQDDKSDDGKLQITKRIELEPPRDKLSSVVASSENKETEKEKPHLGFDFSKSLSVNPPKFPTPETYAFALVYRDLNLKSFGDDDDAPLGIDLLHEPNFQLTLSPDPNNAQVYQAALTLINIHFRRNKKEFIEAGLGIGASYTRPTGALAGNAQLQVEWHITSSFSLTASSVISASKHDDQAPVDYSQVPLGTTHGLDWNWSPVSVGMVWHFK